MKNTFTPKLGIIAIVIFLIFSAILMVSNRNEDTSVTSSASGSPTGRQLAANAEQRGEVGEYYDGMKSPPATSSATPVPKPGDIKQYTYPGSQAVTSNASKLELESSRSAQLITDWYKVKIKELKFNATSFSQTATDGNVLNKLSAAKPGEKIEITIKKDQSASKVLITVDRLN